MGNAGGRKGRASELQGVSPVKRKSDAVPLPTPDPDCEKCRGKGFVYRQNKQGRVVAVPCDACRAEPVRSWRKS